MTDEYILKADAVSRISDLLVFELKMTRCPTWNEVYNAIGELPSADVAPVVRCGHCKYWQDNDSNHDYGYCYAKDGQGFGHAWGKNDFCSYGEREE